MGKQGIMRRLIQLPALCLCLLLAALAPACQLNQEMVFPSLMTLQTGETNSSQTSQSNPTSTDLQQNLTAALPVSQQTLDALRLLFLAKRSGLLNQEPEQYIGLQIQMEDLQQFDSNLTIRLEPVSASSGATSEQVKLWLAAATLPDILFCQAAAANPGLANLIDLNGLLFDNRLLSASHVYAPALDSGRRGQALYGIPYMASVPLIYLNQTLIEQFRLAAPALTWTWNDWQKFSAAAQKAVEAAGLSATPDNLASLAADPAALAAQLAKAVFIAENPADLLPWLPASLNPEAGWAMWNGKSFQLTDPSFRSAASWLQLYAQSGQSLLHLNSSQRLIALGNADARQTGRVMMWTGDSSELINWHQQSGLKVMESFIPAGPLLPENGGAATTPAAPDSLLSRRTPLTVRSLFISSRCNDPALASELAAFIALDADSLLLQSRYQLFEGLVPLVRDQVVWDELVNRQLFGRPLMILKERLPYAYCSGRQILAGWDQAILRSFGTYGRQLLLTSNASDMAALLAKISQAASKAAQEETK